RGTGQVGGVLDDLGAPAGLVRDFRQRLGVDARVDRLALRRINRDRVDERVGAQEARAQTAQRDVARGVGAVRYQDQRGAIARALPDERQGGGDRVVDRRAA